MPSQASHSNYPSIAFGHRQRTVLMEPRFFNHGDSISIRFSVTLESVVSMEPRFFNHGDLDPENVEALIEGFQWSHGSSTMETLDPEGIEALIEGFQWSHGSSTMETLARDLNSLVATMVSMEPRFFNHGDLPQIRSTLSKSQRFQWSHGSSTMETEIQGRIGHQRSLFQWSHGSSTMETPHVFRRG